MVVVSGERIASSASLQSLPDKAVVVVINKYNTTSLSLSKTHIGHKWVSYNCLLDGRPAAVVAEFNDVIKSNGHFVAVLLLIRNLFLIV